jgi:hypothetical protein
MLLPFFRGISPGIVVAVALTGCGALRAHEASQAPADDCVRYLAAAHAALAAPADSLSAPATHAHAIAMHDYHTCLANSRAGTCRAHAAGALTGAERGF